MGNRGSRRGVKRGPYKKSKPRRYPTKRKTSTLEGKREYQRFYMKDYMRTRLNIAPSRFGIRGRKPKVVPLKDLALDLPRIDRRFRGKKP